MVESRSTSVALNVVMIVFGGSDFEMAILYVEYSNTGALSLRSVTVTITLATLVMSLNDASI